MTAIVSTVPVLFLTRVCKYKVKQNSVHPPCSIIKTACCHHFIMRLKNLHKSALHLKVRAVCRAELYSAVDFFLSVETVSVSHVRVCGVWGPGQSPALWRLWSGLLLQHLLPEEGLEGAQDQVQELQGDQPGVRGRETCAGGQVTRGNIN